MARPQAETEWRADDLNAVDEAVRRLTLQRRLPARPPFKPFRRILVGVDGTPASLAAVAWAGEVRQATTGTVTLVTAVAPDPGVDGLAEMTAAFAALERESMESAKRALEDAAAPLEAGGAKVKGILRKGFPAFEIVRVAHDLKADLVVLGSHGHGKADRLLLGSVVDGVRNHVKSSVLIAKGAPGPGPVLIAIDGSAQSLHALRTGLSLAKRWGTQALVFHVFEPPVYSDPEDAKDAFRNLLGKFEMPSRPKGVKYLLALGHPAKQILAYVGQNRPRLVVLGSRGRGAFRTLVGGGVSSRVAHESPVSVLLVKS